MSITAASAIKHGQSYVTAAAGSVVDTQTKEEKYTSGRVQSNCIAAKGRSKSLPSMSGPPQIIYSVSEDSNSHPSKLRRTRTSRKYFTPPQTPRSQSPERHNLQHSNFDFGLVVETAPHNPDIFEDTDEEYFSSLEMMEDAFTRPRVRHIGRVVRK